MAIDKNVYNFMMRCMARLTRRTRLYKTAVYFLKLFVSKFGFCLKIKIDTTKLRFTVTHKKSPAWKCRRFFLAIAKMKPNLNRNSERLCRRRELHTHDTDSGMRATWSPASSYSTVTGSVWKTVRPRSRELFPQKKATFTTSRPGKEP